MKKKIVFTCHILDYVNHVVFITSSSANQCKHMTSKPNESRINTNKETTKFSFEPDIFFLNYRIVTMLLFLIIKTFKKAIILVINLFSGNNITNLFLLPILKG